MTASLLLVAKDDRAVRIEVGYGLEGALPDVIANRITDQVIVPRFRDGDFYRRHRAALDRIIAVLEGEPLPEPQRRAQGVRVEGLGSALPSAAHARVRRQRHFATHVRLVRRRGRDRRHRGRARLAAHQRARDLRSARP